MEENTDIQVNVLNSLRFDYIGPASWLLHTSLFSTPCIVGSQERESVWQIPDRSSKHCEQQMIWEQVAACLQALAFTRIKRGRHASLEAFSFGKDLTDIKSLGGPSTSSVLPSAKALSLMPLGPHKLSTLQTVQAPPKHLCAQVGIWL